MYLDLELCWVGGDATAIKLALVDIFTWKQNLIRPIHVSHEMMDCPNIELIIVSCVSAAHATALCSPLYQALLILSQKVAAPSNTRPCSLARRHSSCSPLLCLLDAATSLTMLLLSDVFAFVWVSLVRCIHGCGQHIRLS